MKLPKSVATQVANISGEKKIQERVNELVAELEAIVRQHNELNHTVTTAREQMAKLEAEALQRQGAIRELQAFLPKQEEPKVIDEPANA